MNNGLGELAEALGVTFGDRPPAPLQPPAAPGRLSRRAPCRRGKSRRGRRWRAPRWAPRWTAAVATWSTCSTGGRPWAPGARRAGRRPGSRRRSRAARSAPGSRRWRPTGPTPTCGSSPARPRCPSRPPRWWTAAPRAWRPPPERPWLRARLRDEAAGGTRTRPRGWARLKAALPQQPPSGARLRPPAPSRSAPYLTPGSAPGRAVPLAAPLPPCRGSALGARHRGARSRPPAPPEAAGGHLSAGAAGAKRGRAPRRGGAGRGRARLLFGRRRRERGRGWGDVVRAGTAGHCRRGEARGGGCDEEGGTLRGAGPGQAPSGAGPGAARSLLGPSGWGRGRAGSSSGPEPCAGLVAEGGGGGERLRRVNCLLQRANCRNGSSARPFGGSSPGSDAAEWRCPGRLHRAPSPGGALCALLEVLRESPRVVAAWVGAAAFCVSSRTAEAGSCTGRGRVCQMPAVTRQQGTDLWIAAALITYPSH